MKLLRLFAALLVAGGLSACASVESVETPTRGAPDTTAPVTATDLSALSANWKLVDVQVNVPENLKVSEANRYYPIADIVWRGDAFGDRRKQIATLMDDAMTAGLSHLQGERPVIYNVTVSRFHSITEKTRYTVGGVHNIIYTLTVLDAATGQPLHGPIKTEISLKAYGGEQAFEAERRGQTQKVRITSHLINKMRAAFPGSTYVVTRNETDHLALVYPADIY